MKASPLRLPAWCGTPAYPPQNFTHQIKFREGWRLGTGLKFRLVMLGWRIFRGWAGVVIATGVWIGLAWSGLELEDFSWTLGDAGHVGLFSTNFISAMFTNPTNWSSMSLCLSGGNALTKSVWERISKMPEPISGKGFTPTISEHFLVHNHYFLYA